MNTLRAKLLTFVLNGGGCLPFGVGLEGTDERLRQRVLRSQDPGGA